MTHPIRLEPEGHEHGTPQPLRMLIGDRWTEAADEGRIPTIDPFNGEAWASVPLATAADVDDALASARAAFEGPWGRMSGHQRGLLMVRFAELIEADAKRMARLESIDNGKVIWETERQIRFAARNYRFFGGYADKLYGETIPLDRSEVFDFTLREPMGVTGLITAWNSPVSLLANKLAPALATGNTAVVKPSEFASVTTLELGRLALEAGIPPGVVNVITGDGSTGAALSSARGVDKISFTGGPSAGARVAAAAAMGLVPVTLELGGKSANIIFADADLERAIRGAIVGIFSAAGQTCIAGSRLLVERSVYAQVADEVVARSSRIRLGDPLEETTQMGPLANHPQLRRVLEHVESGRAEGAVLAAGGGQPALGGPNACFLEPTVFVDVGPQMRIAQEEIFGPVLTIIPFEDESDAIRIANGTPYGLAAGVWTRDVSRALRCARALRAGTVWVNTYRQSAAQAPSGGVGHSGYGRERGAHALHEYTRVKNVMINLGDDAATHFDLS